MFSRGGRAIGMLCYVCGVPLCSAETVLHCKVGTHWASSSASRKYSAEACSLHIYFNPQKNGIKCSNLNHESSLAFD